MGTQSSFFVDGWRVEPDTLHIYHPSTDVKVKIEPKVMKVLVFLASKQGEVVTRDELEANIWAGRVVGYDALANTIIKLRKAFGDKSRHPRIIETIPKTGYRLIAEVQQSVSESITEPDVELTSTEQVLPEPTKRLSIKPGYLVLLLLGLVLSTGLIRWLTTTNESSPQLNTPPWNMASYEKPSVAVLPFLNVSADPVQEYFSDGITEDLITDLSKIQGLNVMARNSVFAYKGSLANEQSIAQELGVNYVLKGSIQRSKNRMRINVQLINAIDGRNLWAERYDRELGDIFNLQDNLVAHIVAALKIELTPVELENLSRKYIASVDAYDEFLKGLEHHGRRSPDDDQLAKTHFRKAIELDPGFARAYAGLALLYSRNAMDGWGTSAQESLSEASSLAQRALQLDRTIPQIYFVMSQIRLSQGNYADAITNIEKAITLNPSYADGYALLGWILHFAGRSKEGLDVIHRAIRLNPGTPAIYGLVQGALHYSRGEFEQAIKVLKHGEEISPHFQQLRVWLAAAYVSAGYLEEANWEITEILTVNPDFSLKTVENAFPFRDPLYRERFVADLRKAGLSE